MIKSKQNRMVKTAQLTLIALSGTRAIKIGTDEPTYSEWFAAKFNAINTESDNMRSLYEGIHGIYEGFDQIPE